MSDFFAENKPLEDLTGRSLRGGVVSLASRAVNAAVQVASVIVLAGRGASTRLQVGRSVIQSCTA